MARVSRIELTFIAGQLARFVGNPGYLHYRAALRVLIYLRGSAGDALVFQPDAQLPLQVYVDSDWSSQFSVSGGIVTMMGCPIYWVSRLQKSVAMSSTEAEYFASSLLAREVMYFRDLLNDVGHTQVGPTTLCTDNKGVVLLSFDPVSFKKTKHILRAAQFVRDLVHRQVVVMKWIPGVENVADICTKAVSLPVFRALKMLLVNLSSRMG